MSLEDQYQVVHIKDIRPGYYFKRYFWDEWKGDLRSWEIVEIHANEDGSLEESIMGTDVDQELVDPNDGFPIQYRGPIELPNDALGPVPRPGCANNDGNFNCAEYGKIRPSGIDGYEKCRKPMNTECSHFKAKEVKSKEDGPKLNSRFDLLKNV